MISIYHNHDLSKGNSFGLKVKAARYIEYSVASDLHDIFDPDNRDGVAGKRYLNLGGGSNILFTSEFYDGTVLHATDKGISFSDSGTESVNLHCGAGAVLDDVVEESCKRGLWGIENLTAIPGTAGAAAVQNVGAYGVEICDVVGSVEVFNPRTLEFFTLSRDECRFGYRDSIFKSEPLVVTAINLVLSKARAPKLGYGQLSELDSRSVAVSDIREKIRNIRDAKLPRVGEAGSAGSFFKNPVVSEQEYEAIVAKTGCEPVHYPANDGVKISAAWLIEHAGLKGLHVGDAALWPMQPLVIVNNGNATSADILKLEKEVIDGVKKYSTVTLQPEAVHV